MGKFQFKIFLKGILPEDDGLTFTFAFAEESQGCVDTMEEQITGQGVSSPNQTAQWRLRGRFQASDGSGSFFYNKQNVLEDFLNV